MRRTVVIAALLAAASLLGGCGTNYYKVHEPDTGRTYYKKGWLAELPGTSSDNEIELVTKEEYERAVQATENR